ncbi:MAG: FHA domain-containing protein [Lentisphaeria bacterium]|nr:FHA domain-containing protein [Lentisphaeria bacterium]
MKAKITFLKGPAKGQSYALPETLWRIGRGHQCDLCIRDEEISGMHLQLGKSADGVYFVEDLGSTNGTLVNGNPLPPQKQHTLQAGDQITLGMSVFLFHDDGSLPTAIDDLLNSTSPLPEQNHSQDNPTSTRSKTTAPKTKIPPQKNTPTLPENFTSFPQIPGKFGRNYSQITNLTEYGNSDQPDKDDNMTLISGQMPGGSSVPLPSSGFPGRPRIVIPPQGRIILGAGITILFLILLFTIMDSKKGETETDSGPFEYSTTDFTTTRPKFWKAETSSNSVFMHSADQSHAVLITTRRANSFFFAPIWKNPSLLKEFLQKNDLLNASSAQQLGVSLVPTLKNLELLDWNGGIKAIAFEMRQDHGSALHGQLAITHHLAILFLAKYPANTGQKCPPRLSNLATWIKLSPPFNNSLYSRPVLEFPPLDRIEKYQQACQELAGISSLIEKAEDQSKYAEAINYYQNSFHKLALAGVETTQEEPLQTHVQNFLSILEKRRQYLRRLQSIILSEAAKGNQAQAVKEAENLYSEAKLTREHQFMQWAWKKLAEWKSQEGKKSGGFL